jgi:hypothetical protein
MQLCTARRALRDLRAEELRRTGLTATGFAVIDMAGKPGATVRFRE